MERTPDTDRTASTERSDFKYYLPATPRLSTEPGRVERFVTNLFRRRGRFRMVPRRKGQ